MNAQGAQPFRPGFAPRGPPRPMPARPLRAADQGPFGWLVPFIPPFLRVNRATREKIWYAIGDAASPEATKLLAERAIAILKVNGKLIVKGSAVALVWLAGLMHVHANVQELATAYVILSAFLALGVHVMSGDATVATDINGETLSAYSVFNKGARRMMGSLSAEQFENEIRHRAPGHDGALDADANDMAALRDRRDAALSDDEEEDSDLLEALRLSLEEKKREERRMRRTQRRR